MPPGAARSSNHRRSHLLASAPVSSAQAAGAAGAEHDSTNDDTLVSAAAHGGRTQLAVRLATIADAEPMRTIYNHEVMQTVATFDLVPRSLEDQQRWIADRSGAFAAIVATPAADPTTVVGFGALSPYKERAAYRTSVENSVYVDRTYARQGIGRLILDELLSIASASGFHAVFARITASSEASIGLHGACGFALVGIEREVGRKFNRWLDVAVMQKLL
jgi:L-amino acid N-acyltransferase